MPLAVTHVLSALLSFDIYRDFLTKHKRWVSLHAVFLAGLGGILPDFDFIFEFIYTYADLQTPFLLGHGGITHTPFFALLFLIPATILWRQKKHKLAICWFALAFGVLVHVLLDFALGGGRSEGIMLLFPFTTTAWSWHVLLKTGITEIFVILDALFFIAWMWYIDWKRKITDYI